MNNDEIPEIVEFGSSEAAGCGILNFANGSVAETKLSQLYFSYIERANLLCNSEGNMDVYYDLVYRIADGKMVQFAAGYYGAKDNTNIQFDEAGEPVYQYKWNDVSMSRDEYAGALNAVYDMTLAKDGYTVDNNYTKKDLIELISKM